MIDPLKTMPKDSLEWVYAAESRIEHLERVLAQAKHAMQANNNCLTTDRPDLPVSPETS